MPVFEKISSRQNPRIRQLIALRERREREAKGVFILEGMRELSRAFKHGVRFLEFYFCPELMRSAVSKGIFDVATRTLPAEKIVELSLPAFEKISYREKPEGVVAVAEMRPHALENLSIPAGTPPLFLVAESIEKPGNLGALLRVADSAGCTALICCGDAGTDVYNPNAIRASQGALFSVPLAVAPSEAVRDWLFSKKVSVFAAAPAAKKIYWECDFRGASAILFGTESTGLSDFWLGKNADASVVPVAIPQLGEADSLNVSTAAAVCLFEAVRQRRA